MVYDGLGHLDLNSYSYPKVLLCVEHEINPDMDGEPFV